MGKLSGVKKFLSSLSFRTGAIIGGMCILFYICSFAQMLLPISASAKGILWIVLYGLAKTTQYTALIILGKEGISRLRKVFKLRKA